MKGYKVVGTGRNPSDHEKYTFLFNFEHAKEHLTIRVLDLLEPVSWDNALVGVTDIIHVASPIPPGVPKD